MSSNPTPARVPERQPASSAPNPAPKTPTTNTPSKFIIKVTGQIPF